MKRAVLLLLGTDIVSAEARAAQVARGIAAPGGGWTDTGPRPLPAGEAVRLAGADQAVVDVYALGWTDAPGSGSVLSRLLGGLGQFGYWARPGFLFAAGGMRRVLAPLLVLSLLMVCLVLSLFGLAAGEIAKFIKGIGLAAEAGWPYRVLSRVGELPLMTVLALLLLFRPVRNWTDMVSIARRYLANSGASTLGLRDAARRRAAMTLHGLLAPGAAGGEAAYDEVVLVAHSMGSVVAADLLTGPGAPADRRLRLVTVGSPAELFRRREAWVEQAVARLPAAAAGLKGWTDLHSQQDWFCDSFPHLPAAPVGEAVSVTLPGSWWARFTGRPHVAYFSHPELLSRLR